MKMTINKLIANDIINYGMEKTTGFNYIISIDNYVDDFDSESQKYILDNLDEIYKDIANNENVAQIDYNKKDRTFDIVFYWDNLLDNVDRYIYDLLQDENKEDCFEIGEIKEISQKLIGDSGTKNLAKEIIKNEKCIGNEL